MSLDAQHAEGMLNAGDDWSDVAHSKRKDRDRFLPDDVILKLMKKSDKAAFLQLGKHLAILGLTSCVVQQCWTRCGLNLWSFGLLLAWFAHGLVIQCLAYAGQHETMHGTAFRTRWLNDLCAFLFSMPGFEFAAHERLMHKDHHTWTNDPHKDPELTSDYGLERFAPGFLKAPHSRADYWKLIFAFHDPIKSHAMRLYNCARGIPVDYSGVRWSLPRDPKPVASTLQFWAQLQLLVYAIVVPLCVHCFGAAEVLVYWTVPAILGFAPVNYLRCGEHGSCEQSKNGLENTRSTDANWLERTLLWNMNYHADHHLYTVVPFYNLPELHKHLRPRLKHQSPSFTQVNRDLYGDWIDRQAAAIESWRAAGSPVPKPDVREKSH